MMGDSTGDPGVPEEPENQKNTPSGEDLDPEDFLRRHPELADELENLFREVKGKVFGNMGAPPKCHAKPEGIKEEQVLGDFRILREIGKGGMAVVYEAEQISLNRRVALKVLPKHLSFCDDAVQKFRREAEAGGRQRHPSIVSIYAVGEHEGTHYIAQELVEGGYTLADKLKELRKAKEFPRGYFREAVWLIAQVADALSHAHTTGVIHRDVKPSNILLTRSGDPKLTDFGLARVEDALALSRTGQFAGTPFYMSPEQAASRRIGIDFRTDVFSLGVTLYEAMTLSLPFEGETTQEVLKRILLHEPRNPQKVNPRVPRDLAVICLKAMEKKPEARYATMADFAEDLKRFLAGEVILAKPAGPAKKLWKRVRRNPAVSIAVAMTFIALFLIVVVMPWFYLHQEREMKSKIMRFSDLWHLTHLLTGAEDLWPASPERIPDLKSWLDQGEELAGRLEDHRKTLEQMRARSQSEDKEDRQLHDNLAELVPALEAFLDESTGTFQSVKSRYDFARTVRAESIEKQKEEWDRALSSIADKEESPLYNGLVIEPQIGLVPLGRDPDSGLWEFGHLQTGMVPERGPDGKLLFTEESGLVFVLIPGGSFKMGAVRPSGDTSYGEPNVDPNAEPNEGPIRSVSIAPFFLSKYEMTQGQWLWFTGDNPSLYKAGCKSGGNVHTLLHPVEDVNWLTCRSVLSRLALRLPSEAEWEYAARAGTTTVWWTGNDKQSLSGTISLSDQFFKNNDGPGDWIYEEWDDGYSIHAPVNEYRPNPFGLHNVCGNVSEWCRDSSHDSYEGAPVDGTPWEDEGFQVRVIRGGAWSDLAVFCRSAERSWYDWNMHSDGFGVRPARSID